MLSSKPCRGILLPGYPVYLDLSMRISSVLRLRSAPQPAPSLASTPWQKSLVSTEAFSDFFSSSLVETAELQQLEEHAISASAYPSAMLGNTLEEDYCWPAHTARFSSNNRRWLRMAYFHAFVTLYTTSSPSEKRSPHEAKITLYHYPWLPGKGKFVWLI